MKYRLRFRTNVDCVKGFVAALDVKFPEGDFQVGDIDAREYSRISPEITVPP